MKTINALIITLLCAGLIACTQDCPQGPNSDSLFCHGQSGQAGDDSSDNSSNSAPDENGNCASADEMACGGVCVNTQTSPAHCGDCDEACPVGAQCVAGGCQCPGSQVECNGACIDPNSDDDYCGATLDCQGANAGQMCAQDYSCTAGTCKANFIYVGTLPPTKGEWYPSRGGLPAANAECAKLEPGAEVCTYTRLQGAAAAGELEAAKDILGNPVSTWWTMDSPALGAPFTGDVVCMNNDSPGKPWTYPTADQGHKGNYVSFVAVDGPANDTTSAVTLGGCNVLRSIPCCMP